MAKLSWKPGTMIYPLPVILVTCGSIPEQYNILTIAWTGTICTNPPMCYISVRKERHSYEIIKSNMEYVINLTTKDLLEAADWCGVKSGKDFNKFKKTGLTPVHAQIVKAPLIAESPLNIECKVKNIVPLGSHDMFISEVVAINADEKYFNEQTDFFNLEKSELIAYSHGKYFELGKQIGKFGYSVKK
jgi:flavin reductase (DIM6/NTAB) family NADH-FMN oxidoreductase RutF